VIPTFAQAFPDLDWGKLADVADDPETVGLTLIPPVTALITRPYPDPPESRIVAPEVLGKIYDAVDQCRPDDLPAGLSKRWAPVAGVPLSVISLRRSLDRGLALDRMIACGFLTEEAARILSEAVAGDENIVLGGPSSSGKTSLLYACVAETPPDCRVVVIEEPEPRAHTFLPLPPNATRINPLAQYGLATTIREQLASPSRPDVMVLGEVGNWSVSLAITAALEDKWAWMASIRGRDIQTVMGRLTTMTAEDKIRKRSTIEEVEIEVFRSVDLVGVMSRNEDRSWLSRLVRPVSPTESDTVYRVKRGPRD
jgi:Flp pilus assembly CpaF family ATPase